MNNKNFTLRIQISRILASATSIAGGYVFLLKFISNTVPSVIASHIITILFLMFIEIGSITFITLGISYIYEKKIAESITFSLVAIVFLTLSFFITATGAKEWVNVNTNKTEVISLKYKDERGFNKTYYSNLIKKETAKYDSITALPEHKYLSIRKQRTEQLKAINSLIKYYSERLKIEENFIKNNAEKAIVINEKKTEETTLVYFVTASVIILFVFIFNFLLVFIKYKKISLTFHNNCKTLQNVASEIKLQEKDFTANLVKSSAIKLQEKTEIFDKKPLQPIEQQVISLKLQGATQRAISANLKISESKVSRILNKQKQQNGTIRE